MEYAIFCGTKIAHLVNHTDSFSNKFKVYANITTFYVPIKKNKKKNKMVF